MAFTKRLVIFRSGQARSSNIDVADRDDATKVRRTRKVAEPSRDVKTRRRPDLFEVSSFALAMRCPARTTLLIVL